MRRSLPVLLAALLLAACAGGTRTVADVITVEGDVTVRGNEPFTAVWLETDERNSYVLDLSSDQRAALVTPRRYRITGEVYRGEWNGVPLARLRVASMQPVDGT